MMRIAGIINTSTVDVPGIPMSVLFTAGCNFHCPYCHNFDICPSTAGYNASPLEIAQKLASNLLVEGANITGGEPTLQSELNDLVDNLRKLNIKIIGIDSNGSRPEAIKQLAQKVNRFAIDFKVPWQDYGRVAPDREITAVQETFAFLSEQFKGDLEARTTIVRQYHSPASLQEMARFLQELRFPGLWVLQEYQFSKGVNPSMKGCFNSWSREELYRCGSALIKNYGLRVALRTASRGFEKVLPYEWTG